MERFPKLCLHWSCLCCTPGPQDTLHSDHELASQLRQRATDGSVLFRQNNRLHKMQFLSVFFDNQELPCELYYNVNGSLCVYLGCVFSQWRTRVRVTRLLVGDWLGCRVTFPLWDFLIRVAVHTEDDSDLGACREPEKRRRRGSLYLHPPARRGRHRVTQEATAST